MSIPRSPLRVVTATVLAALFVYALVSLPGFGARWGWSAGGVLLFGAWAGAAAAGVRALTRRPGPASLIGMALVIAALRFGSATLADGRISPGDPHAYVELARNLVLHGDFGVYESYLNLYCRAFYPPLYPLLLAGWGAVLGFSTGSLLAFGTLIDGAAAMLIALLGARLGSGAAGCRAAWLYLIWPSVVLSAPLAAKEGFCALLVLAIALAWLGQGKGWRAAIVLGGLAGLLALTQPGQAPLAALIGLMLARRIGIRSVIRRGLMALPVAVLVMLPWWARNWLVFGMFVPLTSAGGLSLWVGNNAQATGNWIEYPPGLRDLPEIIVGKRAAALAVDWIRSDPAGFVRLTLTKFVRACGVSIFGVVRLEAMSPTIGRTLAAVLWPVSHLSHAALLALAAWRAGSRAVPGALLLLIAACALQLALFGVWFEFGERHRDFVTPFLLLLLCWPIGQTAVGKAASTP
ncbi:glycosyltransferase [Sphingomonas sp. H39-1-10]|uniref:glycosyltransferase n=1 Tax=Sphingomonas pollutisoli TaxID=3030829 RepID=UPI0023B9B4D2|nr:glycosyltransferase [Sphingomonas pollutisoli]MDF0487139.1 glycosyltransferase [Sphingomonas pollutisoli]